VEVIAELGYARASLAEIGRRAGVSKSLLLYHFAGKDELVDEVVRTLYGEGGRFLAERLNEDLPPQQWLRDYLRACVAFVGARRAGIVALGEILVHRRTRETAPGLPDAVDEPVRHVATQLERGQREGVFRDFSVLAMAMAIRAVLDDVASRYGVDPSIDLDQWAEELVTMFDLATRLGERDSGD
jgi:AcrR family transcriptional regulator